MSDKTLPITLTGQYKGYQVAIQVESTLDSLDKLVNRLQARGIEPLPAPASQGSQGSKRPLETLEGVYVDQRQPLSGPARKVTIRLQDGRQRDLDFWRDDQGLAQLQPEQAIRAYGFTKQRGEFVNFAVQRWELA